MTQQAPHGRRGLRRDAVANGERVLEAAARTVLRDPTVAMATIAAEAGVGVATLYRRFPTREALLTALTQRAFEMVLARAREAEEAPGSGLQALDRFLEATIAHRDQLVLPLHGGAAGLAPQSAAAQAQVHEVLGAFLARGRDDGSIRADLTAGDVVVFGAMLAQGLPGADDWEPAARRQKDLFITGARGPGADRRCGRP